MTRRLTQREIAELHDCEPEIVEVYPARARRRRRGAGLDLDVQVGVGLIALFWVVVIGVALWAMGVAAVQFVAALIRP